MKDKGKRIAEKGNYGEGMITRKKAIRKVGYAAFSAATMMLLLNNPAKGQSNSPVLPPEWGDGDGWN